MRELLGDLESNCPKEENAYWVWKELFPWPEDAKSAEDRDLEVADSEEIADAVPDRVRKEREKARSTAFGEAMLAAQRDWSALTEEQKRILADHFRTEESQRWMKGFRAVASKECLFVPGSADFRPEERERLRWVGLLKNFRYELFTRGRFALDQGQIEDAVECCRSACELASFSCETPASTGPG
jgi:hypothetical protein